MRDSKFGLRAFGLALVAALGLMAFTAVAAQAEEPLEDGGKTASFLVNKEKALWKTGVTFEVSQVGTGTLLVPGRVDILCTGGVVTGGFIAPVIDKNEKGEVTAELPQALGGATFTGCTAWSPVTTFPHATKLACTVATVKEPKGNKELEEKVIVEKAIALPKLHEKAPYVLLEEDGALFTTIFLVGAECPLTVENKVTGSVVGKIVNNDTLNPTVQLSQAIQKLFQVENKETKVIKGDQLKFGTFQAYIDAEGTAKLTDKAHEKLTIGVC